MKDYKLLFVLGLIILFFPFLGIPEFFRNLIIALIGVILITYSFYLRVQYKKDNGTDSDPVFEESEDIEYEEPVSEDIEVEVDEEVLEEAEEFEEKIIEEDNE